MGHVHFFLGQSDLDSALRKVDHDDEDTETDDNSMNNHPVLFLARLL